MGYTRYYYEEPAYVIAGGAVLPFFAIVVTALRLHFRIKLRQPLKADDWLALPATIFAVAIGILMIYAVSQHAMAYRLEIPADFEGDPLLLVTPQIVLAAKTQVAVLLMLPLALGCTKASILFFYLRIFATTKRSRVYSLFAGSIVVIIMMMIGFFFATLFECGSHVSAMWQSATALETYCPNTTSYDYGFAISDFITDAMIFVMPIPLIWRLKMATRNKIALTSTFIVGAGSIVASLIRMIIYTRLWLNGISEDTDEILTITDSLYWGMISTNVATVAASLPLLHPLVKDLNLSTIFESARSFLSLRSVRSGDSDALQVSGGDGQPESGTRYYYYRGNSSIDTTGHPDINKIDQKAAVHKTYPMNDLRVQEEAHAI